MVWKKGFIKYIFIIGVYKLESLVFRKKMWFEVKYVVELFGMVCIDLLN